MATPALITLLHKERAAIKARDWNVLAEISVQKEKEIERDGAPIDQAAAQQIRQLAEQNAQELEKLKIAAESVRLRLDRLLNGLRTVGYGADGQKYACDAELPTRRL